MSVKQILLVALLTFPLVSLAADSIYVATTDLNVRAGAGSKYPISFVLQKGDEVQVLSKFGSWYRIKSSGKTGYSHSRFLRYSRTKSDKRLPTLQQIESYLILGVSVGLALFAFYFIYKMKPNTNLLESVNQSQRGTETERDLVIKLLQYGIPAHTIFHDLLVEKQKGDFTQVDVVVVTEVGIIVFEVKKLSGWIFGDGNKTKWTQVLAQGNQKHRFYNPIIQNKRHITELRKQLKPYGNIPFYSIVVFYGDCELKDIDYVSEGTLLVKSQRVLEAVADILRDNPSVKNINKRKVSRVLKKAVKNGGILKNQNKHAENIKDMVGKHRIYD